MAKPAKKNPMMPDPYVVFGHAYRIVTADVEMRKNPSAQDKIAMASGSMILSAFSIELLFKCLILLANRTPTPSHNLSSLFRQLNHKHKRLIEAEWDRDPAGKSQIAHLARHLKLPTDLPNAINECQRAFEQIRYMYEYGDETRFYLQGLPVLIVNVILRDIKPEWGVPPPIPPTFPTH